MVTVCSMYIKFRRASIRAYVSGTMELAIDASKLRYLHKILRQRPCLLSLDETLFKFV